MEIVAAILGIVTGLWFLWDKSAETIRFRKLKSQGQAIFALDLERTPLFRDGTKLIFGRNTALIGDNVGKTAITEWISVLHDVRKIDRWLADPNSLPIIYSILVNGAPRVVRVSIQSGRVSYSAQGLTEPSSPFPLQVFFIEKNTFSAEELDDASIISKHLGIPVIALQNYAVLVGKAFYCSISEVEFRPEEGGRMEVYVGIKGVKRRYCVLSESEKGRVLAELGIAAAQFASRKSPTLLVIESNSFSFDDTRVDIYLKFFHENDLGFQTIFVSHDEEREWGPWSVIKLIGKAPNADAECVANSQAR